MKTDDTEALLRTADTSSGRPLVELWSGSRFWVGKGCLALLDQGLISTSNFLMSILLARWLTAAQYGAYALGFSIFLFLGSVHGALLVEPLMILGPASYRDHQRAYLGTLILIQLRFAMVFAFTLGVLAFTAYVLMFPAALVGAFTGLSLATPCILLHWLLRQAFYLNQSPAPAAAGAGIYSALLLTGAFSAYRHGVLSPFTVFLLMGIGAAATAIFMLIRLKPSLKGGAGDPTLRQIWHEHWSYGRWALLTNVMRTIPENIAYALTTVFLGMAEVGALKALLNLVLPLYQACASIYVLLQSHVAGIFGESGARATRTPVHRITSVFMASGLVYAVLLALFRRSIFHFLYADRFVEYAYLVPWVALSGLLAATALGPGLGLRANQVPSWVFASYCVGDLTSIAVGTVLIALFGLPGIVATFVLSHLILVITSTLLFRRRMTLAIERESV